MWITVVHGARNDGQVGVYRAHLDPHSPHYGDRRRHLVISAPYRMRPVDMLAAVESELDDAELLEPRRVKPVRPDNLGGVTTRARGRVDPPATRIKEAATWVPDPVGSR